MTTRQEKKAAEQTFHELFKTQPETPESLLVKVMLGQKTIVVDGRQRDITREMKDAAALLLPYRLPRLNSIDATTTTVEMSHDEWIKSLDSEQQ